MPRAPQFYINVASIALFFAFGTAAAQQPPPDMAATKTDSIQVDGDTDGQADAGDTLRYSLVVSNNSAGDAVNVTLDDAPDANTALVVGSVTTTQGTIISGNTGGDTLVSVDIGTVLAFGSVTITFDVIVADPIPAGVTQVANQATVNGGNFAGLSSDDPGTGAADDPTVTPLDIPTTPQAPAVPIPVNAGWALLLMVLLLSAMGAFRLGRHPGS